MTAYHKGELVAFTPCFRDIAGQYFQYGPEVVPFMKRALNIYSRLGLGQKHVLLCYSPWCFRTKAFCSNHLNEKLLLRKLSEKIDEICKKENILFSSFLFVSEFDRDLTLSLENLGYHKSVFWKPMLYLDIPWRNFDDYLQSLGKNTKYQAKREIRSCMENGIVIEDVTDFEKISKTLSDLSFQLLLKYNKWAPRLEPFFYESLSNWAKDNTKIWIAKKKDVIVGFTLFIRKEKTLDFFLVGFDYAAQEKTDFTYFNLAYYTPIKWAIQEGIQKIYYRWGSEGSKYKRGCKPETLYSLVKCRNQILNSQFSNSLKISKKIRSFTSKLED